MGNTEQIFSKRKQKMVNTEQVVVQPRIIFARYYYRSMFDIK